MDLPDPGIEPGSPALQADSLPTEILEKPLALLTSLILWTGKIAGTMSLHPSGNYACVWCPQSWPPEELPSMQSVPLHKGHGIWVCYSVNTSCVRAHRAGRAKDQGFLDEPVEEGEDPVSPLR